MILAGYIRISYATSLENLMEAVKRDRKVYKSWPSERDMEKQPENNIKKRRVIQRFL